jgi:hypothetical protein
MLHHVPDLLLDYGPVYNFWMYPFERFAQYVTTLTKTRNNVEKALVNAYKARLVVNDLARFANDVGTKESIAICMQKYLFAHEFAIVQLTGKHETRRMTEQTKHAVRCLQELAVTGRLQRRWDMLKNHLAVNGDDRKWMSHPNITGDDIVMVTTGILSQVCVYLRAKIGGRVFRSREYESKRSFLKTQSYACKQTYRDDQGKLVSTYGIIEHFAQYRPFVHVDDSIYAKVEWLNPSGTHEDSGLPIFRRNPNLSWNKTHPYVSILSIEAVNVVLIPIEGSAGNQRAFVVCEWEDVG